MEQPSNLTRSSNAATLIRLQVLFPDAVDHAELRSLDTLKASEFQSLYSTGLNRSLTSEGRPSNAIAQIGLRKWAAKLCESKAGSMAPGALFSDSGIALSGEELPSETADRLALAAARNGWLHPYSVSSPQVKALSTAYQEALQFTDDSEARKVICMATLLAPQFWLGNPGPEDGLRRIALEVGRYVPTMKDFEDYRAGRLTPLKLVERIQNDPTLRSGYLDNVKDWHRNWWGLRDFQNSFESGQVQNNGYRKLQLDPRSDTLKRDSSSLYDEARAYITGTLSDGVPLLDVASQTYAHRYNISDYAQNCVSQVNGAPNIQEFDPRTTLLLFEHRHPLVDRWEIVGAFVHTARLAEFEQLVQAYDAGYSAATNCTLHSVLYPKGNFFRRHVDGMPEYYECNGSVSLAGGGFKIVGLSDFQTSHGTTSNEDATTQAARPNAYSPDYQGRDAVGERPIKLNRLIGTVHETWGIKDRRIRRESPSGWQDGISAVKGWYSSAPMYTCNNLTRYFLSCTFRPPRLNTDGWEAHSTSQWTSPSFYSEEGAVHYWIHDGAFFSVSSAANPHILNQFRCGTPNLDLLPASGSIRETFGQALAQDFSVYPRGYDIATYESSSAAPSGLNELLNNGSVHVGSASTYMPDTTEKIGSPTTLNDNPSSSLHPEVIAIDRLSDDLNLEPLRLLEHVLDEDLPYSEVFTADYTIGHEELELFYRTQGYGIPGLPPGYAQSAPMDPSRTELRQLYRATYSPLPSSWFFKYYPDLVNTGYPPANDFYLSLANWSPAINERGTLPALRSSGILSMPAFLGPVTGKLRTVSSRFFTRLLCGEPSVFAPNETQKALHRKYMNDPSNPGTNRSAALHLDETKGCFSCHVNLDPLASALSANFLANVQVDEAMAQAGEFLPIGGNFRGGKPHHFLGARAGGEPGTGAFLGEKVSGIRQVGQVLAKSEKVYSCVVKRTYQEMTGRPPVFADSDKIRTIYKSFKQHRSYDRMVREIAALPGFGVNP